MNDREVLGARGRHGDARNPFHGRWKRREECERKVAHSIPELRTMGPVPGIDGIERFELRDTRPFDDAHQIQAGIGDRACAVGKADQREHGSRSPDFGVIGAGGLQRGEGKNNVADRAGTN